MFRYDEIKAVFIIAPLAIKENSSFFFSLQYIKNFNITQRAKFCLKDFSMFRNNLKIL